jgi:undecaprenyl diphosphate synthase
MIRWIYERMLVRSLLRFPRHLCFLITGQDMQEAPGKIEEVAGWCADLGIAEVTFHISSRDPELIQEFLPSLRRIAAFAHLQIHYGNRTEEQGEGMPVMVAIGKSGREEITDCIRQLAREGMDPETVDEQQIESRLTFRYVPDLVIKTGGQYLTDFLIWQSVYSELFFSDINWNLFRKTDFLRALRDFQSRQRRFGA